MKEHLDQTLAEAADEINGNYAPSVTDYEAVHLHIPAMADLISSGIMHQFPARFYLWGEAGEGVADAVHFASTTCLSTHPGLEYRAAERFEVAARSPGLQYVCLSSARRLRLAGRISGPWRPAEIFRGLVGTSQFRALGYGSYLSFFLPGMVVLSMLFTALQSGMATMSDIDTGMLDKLLIAPIRRPAVLAAGVLADAATMAVQAVILIVIGLAMGARLLTVTAFRAAS